LWEDLLHGKIPVSLPSARLHSDRSMLRGFPALFYGLLALAVFTRPTRVLPVTFRSVLGVVKMLGDQNEGAS